MADAEKATKAAEIEKKTAAPEPEKPTARRAKVVAETGRYVCKEPIVFATPDGQRRTAKAGEVVMIADADARALKKRRIVESEEETADA